MKIKQKLNNKFFHKNFISISYRNRGKEVRKSKNINKKINIIKKLFIKNNIDIIYEHIINNPYSPKNNKTNKLLAYSTLNPEINSLSASLKSNGVRLVSITRTIKKLIHKKTFKNILTYSIFSLFMS
jgi:hypothetical protein